MPNEFTLFWVSISVLYAILAVQNLRWVWRLKKKEGNSALYIMDDGIGVGSERPNDDDIRVTEMFQSILRTDVLGLILGLLAAAYTIFAM